jgi:hypothetical protein
LPKKVDVNSVLGKEYLCSMGCIECFCVTDEVAK